MIALAALACLHTSGVAIPFEMVHGDPVARMKICGQGPFNVLLDTGTSPSVIDLNLAKKLKIKLDSVGQQGDGGGSDSNPAFQTELPEVSIKDFSARNVTALATNLAGIGRQFGRPIDVVLGDSLFDHRVIQFDFPHHLARLYSETPVLGGSRPLAVISFKHEDGEVRLIGARMNGKSIVANLDTGSNSEFSVTPNGIRRLGLEREIANAKTEKGTGFNGSFESRAGKVKSFQLGKIRVSSPSAGFWLPGTGHDRPWDVNVGNKFLQNYVVTIDYRKHRVTFQKGSSHFRRSFTTCPCTSVKRKSRP